MVEILYFLAGLAVCASVVFIIIVAVHKRFSLMLIDLCEGEERARFWAPAIEAWFALFSISSALKWAPEGTTERQLFLSVLYQVKNGLDGTSTAIILLSLALIVFVMIRKFRGRESCINQGGKA